MSGRFGAVPLVVTLVSLALLLTGCPKRPATTAASAPAPGGPPATATPSPPSVGASAPSAPGPAARTPMQAGPPPATVRPTTPPRPAEFSPTAALKDVHFDFDRSDIRPADARILDGNAIWLRANPGAQVLVEGHADERGTNEYNLALGDRRAKATLSYLIGQGIQASRFASISYGEEHPACNAHEEGCWGKNRRAHFLVKER